MTPARSFTLHTLAHAALIAVATLPAQAQEQKLERVEITGSSIKRIDGEAAPVEEDAAALTTLADMLGDRRRRRATVRA